MAARPNASDTVLVPVCPNPIFILGSFRSGTSILAASLGQHSELWYFEESNFVTSLFKPGRLDIAGAYEVGSYWLGHQDVSREEFATSVGLGVNALFTSRSGGKRWIEKSPRNTLIAGTLADLFPGARFLCVIRDGRNAVHSMLNFLDSVSEETKAKWAQRGFSMPWYQDFRTACRAWSDFALAGLDFGRTHPDRCHTIRYEMLVAHPREIFVEVFEFLGVACEEEPIDYFGAHRIKSSFPQWSPKRRDDAWLAWSHEERRIFLDEAATAMMQAGIASADEIRGLETDAGSSDQSR